MLERKDEEVQIDLIKLLAVIWQNILVIILVAAIVGAGTFAYLFFMVTPQYEAMTTLYVNNSTFSIGSTSFSLTNSELTTSKNLVDTYVLVLKSRTTLEKVIEQADLKYNYSQLSDMISTESIAGTAAIHVRVSSASPTEAELIANTIADVLPDRISEIVYGASVQIIDYAIVPSSSSYPNYTVSTVEGAVVGGVITAIIIVLINMFGQKNTLYIDSADDLKKLYPEIMVLAVIPDLRIKNRKGSYYNSSYNYYGSQGKDREK